MMVILGGVFWGVVTVTLDLAFGLGEVKLMDGEGCKLRPEVEGDLTGGILAVRRGGVMDVTRGREGVSFTGSG